MGHRWLINGPVVEWWVDNWVLMIELNKIISVNSVNNQISKFQILMAFVAMSMRARWLVDRPVVERRIPNWVLSSKLHEILFFLCKGQSFCVVADL